jgi:copper(I)-binding protein
MPMPRMIAALAALLMLGACQSHDIMIDKGYVRLPAVKGQPAAAYFTLHGSGKDNTLISISTEYAIRSEMHESMKMGGMSSMKPVDHLSLPADGTLEFKPGGKHLMLYDVNPEIVPGRTLALTFTFADGTRLEYPALVIAAGAAAPKG